MVKKSGLLMLAVAAISLTLISAGESQAFFGRRGGSEGSSGGCSGSYGSSGGSSGSYGSHGGRFFRHRHRDNGGSCGDSSCVDCGSSCSSCDSCSESSSCGCSETASTSSQNGNERQASDRDARGERHESEYNSDTRIHANNQPMPAPEYREPRGDNDRQATERVNEPRDQGTNDRDAKTSPRSSDDSKSESKNDSDKKESSSDNSSDRKQQE
jgi:hypothetical protein